MIFAAKRYDVEDRLRQPRQESCSGRSRTAPPRSESVPGRRYIRGLLGVPSVAKRFSPGLGLPLACFPFAFREGAFIECGSS